MPNGANFPLPPAKWHRMSWPLDLWLQLSTHLLRSQANASFFAELLAQMGGYSASMVAGVALLDYSGGRLPSSKSTRHLAEGKHWRAFIMFFHWRSPIVSILLFSPAPTVEAGLSTSEGKLWKKSSRQTGSFSLPQITDLLKIHREYVDPPPLLWFLE